MQASVVLINFYQSGNTQNAKQSKNRFKKRLKICKNFVFELNCELHLC